LRVLTLEAAVHKMTGLPAERLGLADRGRIAEGAFADLVVFGPGQVRDRATFEEPHQYPDGISYVVVNGAVTVEQGRLTAVRVGRVLGRAARR
jgi:dihydroorotase/N-acyl-D-amino-acid deacylase